MWKKSNNFLKNKNNVKHLFEISLKNIYPFSLGGVLNLLVPAVRQSVYWVIPSDLEIVTL